MTACVAPCWAGATRHPRVASGLPCKTQLPAQVQNRQHSCRLHACQDQHSATSSSSEVLVPAAVGRASMLRLALLSAAAAGAASTGVPLLDPSPAAAAAAAATVALPPLQPVRGNAAGPHSSLVLADPQLLPLPPGPIAFPRRQLDLNFAVLLMRSGYDAVDDLDFIAVNDFQRTFWKLRQAEWEPYTLLHYPLRITQGQLADPLYFDFISFSQFAAASNAMSKGKQVFEEYSEETEGMQVVTRDPSLADNSLLPARFFERHGDRMYHGLVEGFRGELFGGPLPCAPGASPDELLAGVQRVLDLFMDKGYALKATLTPGGSLGPAAAGSGSGSGGPAPFSFSVRLEGPATLWSLQALAARRSQLYNQHDAATVAAFLRASGRSSTCRLSWTDTTVTQQWTVAEA